MRIHFQAEHNSPLFPQLSHHVKKYFSCINQTHYLTIAHMVEWLWGSLWNDLLHGIIFQMSQLQIAVFGILLKQSTVV